MKINTKKSFTLVELMIGVAVFIIIALAIISVLIVWRRSWDVSESWMDAEFQARQAMRRLAEDIAQTSPGTIILGANNDEVTFQLPVSYANGNINWSSQIKYSLGGANNDQLIRTDLNTSQIDIVANYINSLQFAVNNDIVNIQFTVSRSLRGNKVRKELETQVSLRNR